MSHRCHCFSGECKLLLWDWCSILNRQRKQFSSTFLMLNHQRDLIEFGSAHWGSFHKRTVSKIEFDKVYHISAASESIFHKFSTFRSSENGLYCRYHIGYVLIIFARGCCFSLCRNLRQLHAWFLKNLFRLGSAWLEC